jgi:hypothetical protein
MQEGFTAVFHMLTLFFPHLCRILALPRMGTISSMNMRGVGMSFPHGCVACGMKSGMWHAPGCVRRSLEEVLNIVSLAIVIAS